MLEKEIIELYLTRNEEAIQRTQETYGTYCHTIAYRILRDESDVAECINDTWYHAWNAIPPTIPASLKAYLAKITRNLSLNRYRSIHQKKRQADRVTMCIDELQECIPDHNSPEVIFEKNHLVGIINDYLKGLSKEERIMFVRRYFYMDTVPEVASYLNCSQSKVKITMFRCRKKLQQVLIKEDFTI